MRIVPVKYVPGGAWGQCQRCAFKYRLNALKLEWSGLRVCNDCWDPRPEQLSPPNTYPEGLPRADAAPEMPDTLIDDPVTPGDLP